MATRMRILALEARLRRAVVDGDADLTGLAQGEVREAMDKHAAAWQDIQALHDEESASRPYPEGDVCHIFLDEPVFGEHNPPEPDVLLYHYTRAWTLTKIKSKRSLRFVPLSAMNDPQEALYSYAFMMGLRGSPGEPLQITSDEDALFRATDWFTEINQARRDVKVGSFSMDVLPDLADVDPEQADGTVPRRLAANRGFAHPRMWAQYGDLGRGVCLVLNHNLLEQAVKTSTGDRVSWGYGAVNYEPIEQPASLGFFDIRDLLRSGADATVLKNFEDSLLTKHADWAHEAEFRFLVMDGSSEPWSVPISPDVVVGLVLGPEFNLSHLRNVRAFADTFRISHRVRLLQWSSGRAQLHPVAIK